jgi:hypothetical protein
MSSAMNIQDLPKLTLEEVGAKIQENILLASNPPRQSIIPLQEALRACIMRMYNWDLGDDPHGYAGAYDEELQKMAAAFGISLPPSRNI